MDRHTLSIWGWTIIVVLVLAVMIAFATPLSQAVSTGILRIANVFGDHEHTLGPEATCTTPQTCTTCGGIIIAELGHTPLPSGPCTPQVCERCNMVIANAPAHVPGDVASPCTSPVECKNCGTQLADAPGHTPGPAATCTTPQTCTVCGVELAPATEHNFVDGVCPDCGYECTHETWEYYGAGQHECTSCGTIESCDCNSCVCKCGKVYNEHAWEPHGYEQHKCSVCGKVESCDVTYTYTAANRHDGQCNECKGWTPGGHTYVNYVCTVCGGACDHVYYDGSSTIETGTCTECGYVACTHESFVYTSLGNDWYFDNCHKVTCANCGTVITESEECIPAYYEDYGNSHVGICRCGNYAGRESHTLVDGTCTKCGYIGCMHENLKYDNSSSPSYTHKVICADCDEVIAETESCDIGDWQSICSKCGFECRHDYQCVSYVWSDWRNCYVELLACTICGNRTEGDSVDDGSGSGSDSGTDSGTDSDSGSSDPCASGHDWGQTDVALDWDANDIITSISLTAVCTRCGSTGAGSYSYNNGTYTLYNPDGNYAGQVSDNSGNKGGTQNSGVSSGIINNKESNKLY